MPGPAARGVALGRALRRLPGVEAAWLAGDSDGQHVRVLARAGSEVVAEFFARDEGLLVEQARRLRFDDFAREVTVDDLGRTPAQRRADALVEMARRSGAAPEAGRRPAPLFSVFVGYETLAGRICEPADGTVVAPGSLVPWLEEASIERIVFDGPSRVIDVGHQRRLFDGATRRAVEVRDRRCFERPATPAAPASRATTSCPSPPAGPPSSPTAASLAREQLLGQPSG